MTPMKLLSSLRSRIFLASAMLAVLCIGVAIYLVNVRVTEEAERTLQREIVAAASLVDNLRTTRTETFMQMARFIADAPPLKAAVDTNDPPTVQEIANRYQDQVKSNLLLIHQVTGLGQSAGQLEFSLARRTQRDHVHGHPRGDDRQQGGGDEDAVGERSEQRHRCGKSSSTLRESAVIWTLRVSRISPSTQATSV